MPWNPQVAAQRLQNPVPHVPPYSDLHKAWVYMPLGTIHHCSCSEAHLLQNPVPHVLPYSDLHRVSVYVPPCFCNKLQCTRGYTALPWNPQVQCCRIWCLTYLHTPICTGLRSACPWNLCNKFTMHSRLHDTAVESPGCWLEALFLQNPVPHMPPCSDMHIVGLPAPQ